MKISIVVPVYFESSLVNTAHERIHAEVKKNFQEFEIIFVDDGSTDDTFVHLTQLAAENAHVKVIKFSANAGSHMAIRAGLAYATGDAACFIAYLCRKAFGYFFLQHTYYFRYAVMVFQYLEKNLGGRIRFVSKGCTH